MTRRLIREDRYRWRDGRYCHDKEALRADYDGLVARARAMPPEAGLEFAERVEFDFIGSHGLIGAHLRRLAWTAGLPRVDIDFVEAEHLLALGRSDEAYETLMAHSRRTVLEGSVATRAGVLEHLGRICEERFAAPKEAADFYERAIAAGAREAELGPRIMALKDDAARVTHRPLRPGELAGCSPRELRVIERIPVAHGLQHVRSAAWSPDGRRLLVCGRAEARGGYSAFVIDSAGGEIRRIGPAEAAAWCGRGDAVLMVMKIKTPDGKLRYELRTTSDEAAARPWPDDLRGRPGAVSVSPGGNSFAATVGLAGCEGEGIAVVMSHRGSPPREILVRHDHWSSVDALVGWRKASELVVRVCGEVKVYDAGARTWRGMSASRLGPGRYGQWLSPTGTHIAYARNRDMHGSRLYVARPNGGEPSLVDFEWRYARGYGEPRWSPDGTKLLVKSAGRDARSGDTTYTLSVLVLGRRVARSAPAGIAHSRR